MSLFKQELSSERKDLGIDSDPLGIEKVRFGLINDLSHFGDPEFYKVDHMSASGFMNATTALHEDGGYLDIFSALAPEVRLGESNHPVSRYERPTVHEVFLKNYQIFMKDCPLTIGSSEYVFVIEVTAQGSQAISEQCRRLGINRSPIAKYGDIDHIFRKPFYPQQQANLSDTEAISTNLHPEDHYLQYSHVLWGITLNPHTGEVVKVDPLSGALDQSIVRFLRELIQKSAKGDHSEAYFEQQDANTPEYRIGVLPKFREFIERRKMDLYKLLDSISQDPNLIIGKQVNVSARLLNQGEEEK